MNIDKNRRGADSLQYRNRRNSKLKTLSIDRKTNLFRTLLYMYVFFEFYKLTYYILLRAAFWIKLLTRRNICYIWIHTIIFYLFSAFFFSHSSSKREIIITCATNLVCFDMLYTIFQEGCYHILIPIFSHGLSLLH